MDILQYYEIITKNKNYEKIILKRSNWKIASVLSLLVFTILFIVTMIESIIWAIQGNHENNILGFISIFGYVVSIIALVIIDNKQPLDDIKGDKDQFFVLLYIIQKKLEFVDENKILNLQTICFYDMINLTRIYLGRMENYYNNIFLSESEGEQKLVISNLKMILSKKLEKLLNNKEEFKQLIELYINAYKYEIDNKKIPQEEYKKINEYIRKLDNLNDKVTNIKSVNNKNKNVNVARLIKPSIISVLAILGVYFATIVIKNNTNSSIIANLYTVIGTTVSLILTIITFKFNIKK